MGDKWYSWTQFESIDARAAYPGFDEPGFKTPFTVSVKTYPGYVVVGNAPEISVTKLAGGLEKHQLEVTKPLPTYLVAIDTGPFAHKTGTIATDAERSTPMPYGAVATQAQAAKMGYVMAETPRIVSLLENYFGEPFPFPKLDQIGTPIMPGAMENAGADTYGDDIIYPETRRDDGRQARVRDGRRARVVAPMVRRSRDAGMVGRHLVKRKLRQLDGLSHRQRVAARAQHRSGRARRRIQRDEHRRAGRRAPDPPGDHAK